MFYERFGAVSEPFLSRFFRRQVAGFMAHLLASTWFYVGQVPRAALNCVLNALLPARVE